MLTLKVLDHHILLTVNTDVESTLFTSFFQLSSYQLGARTQFRGSPASLPMSKRKTVLSLVYIL